MAGMLPGVESARRRRFYSQGESASMASPNNSTRRSLSLYSTKHDSLLSSSSLQQRSKLYSARSDDEKLEETAREAKERLDERLRALKKSPNSSYRQNGKEKPKEIEERTKALAELRVEVYASKRNGSRMFNWSKMSWKALDQEECAVCLELFKDGETLLHLPCAHRFHSKCLEPWLPNNTCCPCCRMSIISL